MTNLAEPNTQLPGLSVAVYKIFKATARFSIRRGVSIAAMGELLRRAYLAAAVEIIAEEKSKVTTSRICAMTGLYRREVRRLETLPPIGDNQAIDKLNRSSRVVSGWVSDSEFQTKTGRPAVLKLEGKLGFEGLVRKYSGDVTPNAIRLELERLGKVVITKGGSIKLQNGVYLNTSDAEGLEILGDDTAELIHTITRNLDVDRKDKLFQRKVSYINIPERRLIDFQKFAEKESQGLLVKLDKWLSGVKASPEDTVKYKLSVGVYHFLSDQSVLDITQGYRRPTTAELIRQGENFE